MLRCYVVWDNNKFILIPSSIAIVIGTGQFPLLLNIESNSFLCIVFGFLSEGTMSVPLKKYISVYILMVVFFNLFLTLLTGQ